MAKRMAKKQSSLLPEPRRRRKVTYSLPETLARDIDRRCAGSPSRKSHVVAEALAFYFAAQDRRALEAVFAEAASDPLFRADNLAVQEDFAALDRETQDPPG